MRLRICSSLFAERPARVSAPFRPVLLNVGSWKAMPTPGALVSVVLPRLPSRANTYLFSGSSDLFPPFWSRSHIPWVRMRYLCGLNLEPREGNCSDLSSSQGDVEMKRVRQFYLQQASPNASAEYTSWHQTWDAAVELLKQSPTGDSAVDVLEAKNSTEVVARFCSVSLHDNELDDATEGVAHWDSEFVGEHQSGSKLYANLNIIDYHWEWVEGARHRVPLRLGFLERKAELHPEGWAAYGLYLLSSYRDILLRR